MRTAVPVPVIPVIPQMNAELRFWVPVPVATPIRRTLPSPEVPLLLIAILLELEDVQLDPAVAPKHVLFDPDVKASPVANPIHVLLEPVVIADPELAPIPVLPAPVPTNSPDSNPKKLFEVPEAGKLNDPVPIPVFDEAFVKVNVIVEEDPVNTAVP
jgi:hypothetical protein